MRRSGRDDCRLWWRNIEFKFSRFWKRNLQLNRCLLHIDNHFVGFFVIFDVLDLIVCLDSFHRRRNRRFALIFFLRIRIGFCVRFFCLFTLFLRFGQRRWFSHFHAEDGPLRQVLFGRRSRGHGAQPNRYGILRRLTTFQCHLRGHDALTFRYQIAFGTATVLVVAMAFVSLEPRYHAVIATTSTLGLTKTTTATTTVIGSIIERVIESIVDFVHGRLIGVHNAWNGYSERRSRRKHAHLWELRWSTMKKSRGGRV